MTFEQFPALNKQHETKYDLLAGDFFTGDPTLIHEKVERKDDEEQKARRAAARQAA